MSTLVTVFVPMVLVCSPALDHTECVAANASVSVPAEPAHNEIQCGFYGQAMMASAALGIELRNGEYLKIACLREERLASAINMNEYVIPGGASSGFERVR